VLPFRPFFLHSRGLRSTLFLLLISYFGCGCASQSISQSASLSLSTSSFNFKTVVIGQTFDFPLVVSNTGTAPLHITALSISNNQFSISGPSIPRTVLPSNSLSYTVSFTPTSSGNISGTINFSSNAGMTNSSVSLAGSGEKAFADLVVTPPSINFGNLALKSKSTQNVTLQNTGDINLAIQGVALTGAGFGYSNISPGLSLAPNQKVTFQVWFSPAVAGQSAATVSFLSSNLSSPGSLSLTGDGVNPAAAPPSSPAPSVQHVVHLAWNASTSPAIGYFVYRSQAPNTTFGPLFGAAINLLTYDDTAVVSGTTYYYVVTAVDSSGQQSINSNQATAVIP